MAQRSRRARVRARKRGVVMSSSSRAHRMRVSNGYKAADGALRITLGVNADVTDEDDKEVRDGEGGEEEEFGEDVVTRW